MNGVFDYDSALMSLIRKLADVFVADILWLVCCIPIVTIGASTTALYYVTLRLVRESDGHVVQSFFQSFRTNFKQATAVWLIFVGLILVWCVDFYYILFLSTWNPLIRYSMMIFLIVLALVWVSMILYVFPIIARFENSTKEVMKNAYVMATKHIVTTIEMLCILALLFYIAVTRLPILLSFCVGIGAFLNSYLLHGIFSNYIEENQTKIDT